MVGTIDSSSFGGAAHAALVAHVVGMVERYIHAIPVEVVVRVSLSALVMVTFHSNKRD